MSVNGINNSYVSYASTTSTTSAKTTKKNTDSSKNSDAVAYKKSSSSSSKSYKADATTIAKLKADAEKKTEQLRSLVEKLCTKQGKAFTSASEMYTMLRTGQVNVDAETAAQAQKDISEDGYWGVEQTSNRLVSFAQALSGGDPAKADEMMAAVQKGVKQATRAWGGELPDICGKTVERTMEKMTAWRDSISEE